MRCNIRPQNLSQLRRNRPHPPAAFRIVVLNLKLLKLIHHLGFLLSQISGFTSAVDFHLVAAVEGEGFDRVTNRAEFVSGQGVVWLLPFLIEKEVSDWKLAKVSFLRGDEGFNVCVTARCNLFLQVGFTPPYRLPDLHEY